MFEKHKAAKVVAHRQAAIDATKRTISSELTDALQAHDDWELSKLQYQTNVPGTVLRKDEVAYGCVKDAVLVEPKVMPGHWSGGSQGVSFRIAKGVSYRVGQSRGTFTPGVEQEATIDVGIFVITNQRCSFSGTKRSVEWAYSKLLGFSIDGPGKAVFNVSNRQKASGVIYGAEIEHTFDTIIAAAIAQYMGADHHVALVEEKAAEYRTARSVLDIHQKSLAALEAYVAGKPQPPEIPPASGT